MKTITKPVYYCDFCKKKGLSAGHISRHEKHCTGNINRTCRVCDGVDIKPLIKKYTGRFKIKEQHSGDPFDGIFSSSEWIGEPVKPEMILNDVDNCPACALTVVRLSDLTDSCEFYFDYQEAHDKWWAAQMKEEAEADEHYSMYY